MLVRAKLPRRALLRRTAVVVPLVIVLGNVINAFQTTSLLTSQIVAEYPEILSVNGKSATIGMENHNSGDRSFAACLLNKDDNHHLVEWLAYNYQVLPLRRLIVAKDAYSKTSPTHILDRYQRRNLMDITEWEDQDFFESNTLNSWKIRLATARNDTLLSWFLTRQKNFLRACMMELITEAKWTWTLLVDVDEFLTLSLPNSGRELFPELVNFLNTLKHPEDMTAFELLQKARFSNFSQTYTNPCIQVPRLLFGSKEDDYRSKQLNFTESAVPGSFKASDFLTFRWIWRHRDRDRKNGPHKAVIDLSRVDPLELKNVGNINPHRPIRSYCSNAFEERKRLIHSANHYIGNLEQWHFRSDPRAGLGMSRTTQLFHDKSARSGTLDLNAPKSNWLVKFVENVGMEEAQLLLQGVGQVDHPSFHTSI